MGRHLTLSKARFNEKARYVRHPQLTIIVFISNIYVVRTEKNVLTTNIFAVRIKRVKDYSWSFFM